MCRLFGFRSVIPSMVHRSLLETENALGTQSERHPDGWGVAYYVDGAPHLTRSAAKACTDQLFRRVSGVVSSDTVVAHVRKATVGELSVLNSHPFQYGRWVFAHNGQIPDFEGVRERLLERVDPRLRPFVLGSTDSEVLFFVFLTRLGQLGALPGDFTAAEVALAMAETQVEVREIYVGRSPAEDLLLNFIATNGATLVACRAGKELFWSSHKTRCADRATCSSLGPACESPTTRGSVKHIIISSEPLGGENVWQELPDGHVIGVDGSMRLFQRSLEACLMVPRRLRVVS